MLREFKHRKLTSSGGGLVTDRKAALGMAFAASGQPGAKLTRRDHPRSHGGKNKPKLGNLRSRVRKSHLAG